ncbi:peroxiredoxin family protein [Embleya sp. NPDC050493]|uniref:peroxiredoxin family protein n=1 Tax=Embleya sp. NPDC050493 TaxID=3363989 RepID=UPI0037A4D483
MPILVVAVVLVGLVTVLNLVLVLGVLRRLRGQQPQTPHSAGPPMELRPGMRPGVFTATTTTGEQVGDHDAGGLVGFFSAGCEPCHVQAPRFAERARALGRERTLAVIAGDDAELLALLTPVARVVVEEYDGVVQAAFRNAWTPAMYLLGEDRRVVAAGLRMTDLPTTDLPTTRRAGEVHA